MARKGISHGPCECQCLHNSVLVESLVITLTIVACLAVAVRVSVDLDFITVPKSSTVTHENNDARGNQTPVLNQTHDNFTEEFLLEDKDVLDIMEQVLSYMTYAIAAVFVLEIVAKVTTLRKRWIKNCWQVFDALVVLANAGVQITFYLISVSTIIYCASFVIILRLWRIPFVCYMKASQTREQLEQDVELYRSGKCKAEDRCDRLENDLAVKKEKIRKLEEMLRNRTDQENEMNTVTTPVMGMTYLSSGMNSDMENGILKSELLNEKERNTNLTNQPRANHLGNGRSFKTEQKDVLRAKYASIGIFTGTLPRSEVLYNITSFIDSPSLIENSPRKQYRRNLSTSDFMAYSTLSSPERQESFNDELKELSNSCPCLDIYGEDLDTKLTSEDHQPLDQVDGNNQVNKQPSVASGTSSDVSSATGSAAGCSVNSDEHNSKARRKVKRFSSCPEYVYTQRMSVTSDESILLEEKHTRFDPVSYENSGFLDEGDNHLQILAEIDGTKIYRSEDGVPMTSL